MDSPPPYIRSPIPSSDLPAPPSTTTTPTPTTRRRKLTAEDMLHRMGIAPPHVPHSSSSPLLSLPTTPFVQILGHVPPESVAALSLTCRALHTSTLLRCQSTVSKIGTDKAVRLRLMQLLERDGYGDHVWKGEKGKKEKRHRYLCHSCAAYHPYDPKDTPKNYDRNVKQEQKKRNKGEGGKCNIADDEAVCFYNQYMIRSYHVQLALRSRAGGGGNIIPSSAFTFKKMFKLGGLLDRIVWQNFQTRVLDGQLFLWGYYAYHKWEYPCAGATSYRGGGAAGGVTTNLERQEWRICPHHRVCAELPVAKPPERDAQTAGGGGGGGGGGETLDGLLLRNLPRAAMVGNKRTLNLGWSCCKHCDTDYTVTLQCFDPLDFAKGTWLRVHFFRNLGSARAPDDPKWRFAVEDASGTPPNRRKANGKCGVADAYCAAARAEEAAAKEAGLATGLKRGAKRTLDRARQKIADILGSFDGDDGSKKADAWSGYTSFAVNASALQWATGSDFAAVSSVVECQSEHVAYSSRLSAFQSSACAAGLCSTTVSSSASAFTTKFQPDYTGALTTLCDGWPRATGEASPTRTSTWFLTETLYPRYTAEAAPRCTYDSRGCGLVVSAQSRGLYRTAGNPDCLWGGDCIVPREAELQCRVAAGEVKVFFWPISKDDGWLCTRTTLVAGAPMTTTVEKEKGVVTATYQGMTFTSPSIYLSFSSLSAYPCVLGSTRDVWMSAPPESFSSLRYKISGDPAWTLTTTPATVPGGSFYDTARVTLPMSWGDMNSPVPAEAYRGMRDCQFWREDNCSTIYDDYKPDLALPTQPSLFTHLDPRFANCSKVLWWGSVLDPPIPLTTADALIPQSSQAAAATTTTDADPGPATTTTAAAPVTETTAPTATATAGGSSSSNDPQATSSSGAGSSSSSSSDVADNSDPPPDPTSSVVDTTINPWDNLGSMISEAWSSSSSTQTTTAAEQDGDGASLPVVETTSTTSSSSPAPPPSSVAVVVTIGTIVASPAPAPAPATATDPSGQDANGGGDGGGGAVVIGGSQTLAAGQTTTLEAAAAGTAASSQTPIVIVAGGPSSGGGGGAIVVVDGTTRPLYTPAAASASPASSPSSSSSSPSPIAIATVGGSDGGDGNSDGSHAIIAADPSDPAAGVIVVVGGGGGGGGEEQMTQATIAAGATATIDGMQVVVVSPSPDDDDDSDDDGDDDDSVPPMVVVQQQYGDDRD
ncbi:hypothetical protein SLS58_010219 [Diplodia intermedia]|uniref:F-box domain-containing protein n=1 Tax=Diplodia intermedia TaxID=856260 RepID=A0ABR3T7G7_9PEZI